jgi:hypothetical protein
LQAHQWQPFVPLPLTPLSVAYIDMCISVIVTGNLPFETERDERSGLNDEISYSRLVAVLPKCGSRKQNENNQGFDADFHLLGSE